MKARIIWADNAYHLLLSTGKISKLSILEIRAFLETYSSPVHYSDDSEWDYDISMEEYEGETLAYVDDSYKLIICSADFMKAVLNPPTVKYLSPAEYAEKVGRNRSLISKLCIEGRFPGLINVNGRWLIPEDAPYPADSRRGKREKLTY